MHAAVEIDADAQAGAARRTHSHHAGQHGINLHVGIDVGHFVGGVHFDGGKTFVHHFLGRRAHVFGPVAANPGVHPHFIAHPTAQQLMNRRVVVLALDVPQRLVDTRNG